MGIVHHGSYLLYFEAARVEWLRRRGITYADWAAKGIHTPVVETHTNHLAPARFDDLLQIETTLVDLRTVSLKFAYRARRDDTVIAEGWTRLGCIDANYKLLRITEEIRSVLLSPEQVPS